MTVSRSSGDVTIRSPKIISGAGAYNTFQRLLPPYISHKSYYSEIFSSLKPAESCMHVFLGLNASNEELNLKKNVTLSYSDNNAVFRCGDFVAQDIDEALSMSSDVPVLFISFPSAKGGINVIFPFSVA